jgi:hypothetical protein
MHELFTTAVVPNSAVFEILKILQGLCGMTPVHQSERRLIFEGPKSGPLVGIPPQLPDRKRENVQLWKELHQQLVRQSYYITISYDVTETHFGQSAPEEPNLGPEGSQYVLINSTCIETDRFPGRSTSMSFMEPSIFRIIQIPK